MFEPPWNAAGVLLLGDKMKYSKLGSKIFHIGLENEGVAKRRKTLFCLLESPDGGFPERGVVGTFDYEL